MFPDNSYLLGYLLLAKFRLNSSWMQLKKDKLPRLTENFSLFSPLELLKLISNLCVLFSIVVFTSRAEGDEEVGIDEAASRDHCCLQATTVSTTSSR